jgi:hypothetical protein
MAHDNAIRVGKADTDGRCVFRGTTGTDGAHLFPAGDFHALADYFTNVFAVSRDLHSTPDKACFDFKWVNGVRQVRPVSERIWMLENMSLDEFRGQIRQKLDSLAYFCEQLNIEFPESEKPSDYYSLIRGLR